MKQIVLHDSSIFVGHVLELLVRAHIAQREDSCSARPQVLVDNDQPSVIDLDPRSREVERVAVRRPPGGDQEHLSVEVCSRSLWAHRMHAYARVGGLDRPDARFQADIHSPAEEFGEARRHVGVLPPQQDLGAVQHGHRRSECGEDVSKFGRHVPAADDDHGSGQLGQPHHRVGRVKLHRAQARQIGNHGATTGRNHDLVGTNRLRRPDVQLPRSDEASAAVEDCDIVTSLAVAAGRWRPSGQSDRRSDPGSPATGRRGGQDKPRAWSPER